MARVRREGEGLWRAFVVDRDGEREVGLYADVRGAKLSLETRLG
ncbi:MAG TPA: hypothetical protein VGW74_06875 [Propionibacteriaceae bacterium]|nr:hypothetical protein [Propionibacteriaceae bacterium]